MEKLGIGEGEFIRIMTEHGSVVIRAITALEEVPPGIIFVPYGPWINLIIKSETHGTGMPSYKGIEVEVVAAGVDDIFLDEHPMGTSMENSDNQKI
jgi:formylmethanofuran dehydrogenase subunit D